MERAVAFADREGFCFSVAEARSFLKAKAAAHGETITYKYIDSLPAEGFFPYAFFREMYLVRDGGSAYVSRPSQAKTLTERQRGKAGRR